MGGLTTGMIWGLLVSALGLAALSLSSPLPPRDGQGGMGAVPGEIVVVGDEGAPDGTDATDSALASADADAAEAEAETGTDVDPASGADAVAEIESPEAEPATPEPADTEAAAAPATAVPLPAARDHGHFAGARRGSPRRCTASATGRQ